MVRGLVEPTDPGEGLGIEVSELWVFGLSLHLRREEGDCVIEELSSEQALRLLREVVFGE